MMLKKIDTKIVVLRRLVELDASNNLISILPREFPYMPALTQLNLSSNKLADLNPQIFEGNISNTLYKIDLSNNEVS